jgi:hypothetical protein
MLKIIISLTFAFLTLNACAPVTVEGQKSVQQMEIFEIGTRYTILSSKDGVTYDVFYTKGYQYFPDRVSALAECAFQSVKIGKMLAEQNNIKNPKIEQLKITPNRNMITAETSCTARYKVS